MKKMICKSKFSGIAWCFILIAGITTSSVLAQHPPDVTSSVSPIDIADVNVKFYKNIQYSDFKENILDIFIPESEEPVPLIIYIHGGGFIDGDKAKSYEDGSAEKIKKYLSNKTAFASINYRLLTVEGSKGVLTSLNDCKRALQFLRYHAKSFKIDKERIVIMGASAGAGASLWLGFHDEMADKNNADPVLRQSTRVSGIVAIETQADYDIIEWPNTVFKEYRSLGLDFSYIRKISGDKKIVRFLGLKDISEINLEETKKYREQISMLKMMSKDDPELYAVNAKLPPTMPKRTGELNHHPLHVKALMKRAKRVGLRGRFYIPQMNIDTRNGESQDEFIFRVLAKKQCR